MPAPTVRTAKGEAVTSTVVVDGASLTCAAVAAVARRQADVAVGERAVAAAHAAWRTGQELAARRPGYGRKTGGGANHAVGLREARRTAHGIPLLRSPPPRPPPLPRPPRAPPL